MSEQATIPAKPEPYSVFQRATPERCRDDYESPEAARIRERGAATDRINGYR